ncbi:MAG: hypothetical protein ABID38_02675 [Candidatus Diapherotrites archaeon]
MPFSMKSPVLVPALVIVVVLLVAIILGLLVLPLILGDGQPVPGEQEKKPGEDYVAPEPQDWENPKGTGLTDGGVPIDPTTGEVGSPSANLFYSKNCGAGQAIQGFDLQSSQNPTCVSIESGRSGTGDVISPPPETGGDEPTGGSETHFSKICGPGEAIQSFSSDPLENPTCVEVPSEAGTTIVEGEGVTIVDYSWNLSADGSESVIDNGETVEIEAGAGILVYKEGNTVSITATEAFAKSVSYMNDFKLVEAKKFPNEINVSDGLSVGLLGTGGIDVSIDESENRVIISNTKQYEYGTFKATCNSSGVVNNDPYATSPSGLIHVGQCTSQVVLVYCENDDAKIISYGGTCGNAYIKGIYPYRRTEPADSWQDFGGIDTVELECSAATSKTVFITCMREKA